MKKLVGKVAVVTGASKGIGAGIARAFGAEGASVVVNYSGDRDGAQRTVDAIETAGAKAIAVQANIASEVDVQRLFAETRKTFGKLDVLVNNAGVFGFGALETITVVDYRKYYDTNVLGTLLVTREALPLFGSEGGSIINLTSIVSKNPPPGAVLYTGTKAAIDTMTVALSRELAVKKIRVNAIAPGSTDTEGTHAAGIAGGEFEKMLVARTPLGRIGHPEDIAKVAVFLASEDSAWVTGERINASGGDR